MFGFTVDEPTKVTLIGYHFAPVRLPVFQHNCIGNVAGLRRRFLREDLPFVLLISILRIAV
jgi:hypothetical protein